MHRCRKYIASFISLSFSIFPMCDTILTRGKVQYLLFVFVNNVVINHLNFRPKIHDAKQNFSDANRTQEKRVFVHDRVSHRHQGCHFDMTCLSSLSSCICPSMAKFELFFFGYDIHWTAIAGGCCWNWCCQNWISRFNWFSYHDLILFNLAGLGVESKLHT